MLNPVKTQTEGAYEVVYMNRNTIFVYDSQKHRNNEIAKCGQSTTN